MDNSYWRYAIFAMLAVLAFLFREMRQRQAVQLPPGLHIEAAPVVPDAPIPTGIREGDLVFQNAGSQEAAAVRELTHATYSNCGILLQNTRGWVVLEAGEHVRFTPFGQWIARGTDQKYEIRRLKNADQVLSRSVLDKMMTAGYQMEGIPFDVVFGWSDSRIYGAELVWKAYQQATDLELGKLQKLRDFDLSGLFIQAKLKERFGQHPPLDELVLSPDALLNSDLLTPPRLN